jgi:hypothetical protein
MKIVSYEKIKPKVIHKFHRNDSYVNGLDHMFLVDDMIEIFEFKNVVDIYFDRCFPLDREGITYINTVEKKFKKSVNVYISIKNPCMDKIIVKLGEQGYGCPRVVVKSINNVLFKTPKIIVTNHCKTKSKLQLGDFSEPSINFSKNDVDYFKTLLTKQFECGGNIKYTKSGMYKIVRSSVIKGDKDTIDLDISQYNFHTHPKSVYDGNFVGWFSGEDIKYIIYNSLLGLDYHFLVTMEGVYIIGMTKEFISDSKIFGEKKLDDIVDYIYNMFVQLEDLRFNNKSNTIDDTTVRIFNDFFVIINSINSKWFNLSGNYRLFNLEFKKWNHFK